MDKGDDIFNHINKIKSLANQLMYLEMHVKDEDMVMILLKSLSHSLKHLITVFEMHPMKKLTIFFVTMLLMHEVSKRKDKESLRDDTDMVMSTTNI